MAYNVLNTFRYLSYKSWMLNRLSVRSRGLTSDIPELLVDESLSAAQTAVAPRMPHQMMIIYALVIVAVSPFHFYATAVFRSSRVRSEKSLSTARRCAASSCAELGLNVFVPMFTVGNRLTAWTRCCVEVVAAVSTQEEHRVLLA
jgi:hypothetical protein